MTEQTEKQYTPITGEKLVNVLLGDVTPNGFDHFSGLRLSSPFDIGKSKRRNELEAVSGDLHYSSEFHDCDFRGLSATNGVSLPWLHFFNCLLQGVDLESAKPYALSVFHSDFSGANLKGVSFSGATGGYFTDSNLSKTDLSGISDRIDARYCNLGRAKLVGARGFVDLRSCNCDNADFSQADFARFDSGESDCTNASFVGAYLRNGEIWGCVRNADFTGTTIEEMYFAPKDIETAKGLGSAKFIKTYCSPEVRKELFFSRGVVPQFVDRDELSRYQEIKK